MEGEIEESDEDIEYVVDWNVVLFVIDLVFFWIMLVFEVLVIIIFVILINSVYG